MLVDDLHPSVVADIKKVIEQEEVILVHGGGKEVTKVTEQLGKEPRFVVLPWRCKKQIYRPGNCRNFHHGYVWKNQQDNCKDVTKKRNQMQWVCLELMEK